MVQTLNSKAGDLEILQDSAFNEEGRLFTAVNGADERGSRPIVDDADKFFEVKLNSYFMVRLARFFWKCTTSN